MQDSSEGKHTDSLSVYRSLRKLSEKVFCTSHSRFASCFSVKERNKPNNTMTTKQFKSGFERAIAIFQICEKHNALKRSKEARPLLRAIKLGQREESRMVFVSPVPQLTLGVDGWKTNEFAQGACSVAR